MSNNIISTTIENVDYELWQNQTYLGRGSTLSKEQQTELEKEAANIVSQILELIGEKRISYPPPSKRWVREQFHRFMTTTSAHFDLFEPEYVASQVESNRDRIQELFGRLDEIANTANSACAEVMGRAGVKELKKELHTKNKLSRALKPIIADEFFSDAGESSLEDPYSPFGRAKAACRQGIEELGIDGVISTLEEVIRSEAPDIAGGLQAKLFVNNVRMHLQGII